MSILLRQPGGFEGLAFGAKEGTPEHLSVSQLDGLPHRLLDRDAAQRASHAEMRDAAVARSADVDATPIARRRKRREPFSTSVRTPSWPRKVVPSASATIDVNSTSSVVSATNDSRSPELIASKAASANLRSSTFSCDIAYSERPRASRASGVLSIRLATDDCRLRSGRRPQDLTRRIRRRPCPRRLVPATTLSPASISLLARSAGMEKSSKIVPSRRMIAPGPQPMVARERSRLDASVTTSKSGPPVNELRRSPARPNVSIALRTISTFSCDIARAVARGLGECASLPEATNQVPTLPIADVRAAIRLHRPTARPLSCPSPVQRETRGPSPERPRTPPAPATETSPSTSETRRTLDIGGHDGRVPVEKTRRSFANSILRQAPQAAGRYSPALVPSARRTISDVLLRHRPRSIPQAQESA